MILNILQSNVNRYGSYLDVLHADNVNFADIDGNTPLMFAAEHGLLEILRVLIDKGADVNAADNNDWTALMSAANQGNLTTVQVLLDKGANIKQTNADGLTVLDIIAIKEPNEVNLKLLELLRQYNT
jgi:ankyrin repeat protein